LYQQRRVERRRATFENRERPVFYLIGRRDFCEDAALRWVGVITDGEDVIA
jgi:hypothetical protein